MMVMIFFLKMPFSNVIRTNTSFLRFVSFLFILSHNGTSIKSHQSQILKGPQAFQLEVLTQACVALFHDVSCWN